MYIPTTLSELIEYGKNIELSHRNVNNRIFLHNVKSDEILKLPFNPSINKYRDFFGKHTVRLELTEEEQDRYWYHPKKLSYDYYGSVEYWSIILYINFTVKSLLYMIIFIYQIICYCIILYCMSMI